MHDKAMADYVTWWDRYGLVAGTSPQELSVAAFGAGYDAACEAKHKADTEPDEPKLMLERLSEGPELDCICGSKIYAQDERYGVAALCCECVGLYMVQRAEASKSKHKATPEPDEPQIVADLRGRIDKLEDSLADWRRINGNLRRLNQELETALANARRANGKLKRHNQTLQNLLGARIDAEPDEPKAAPPKLEATRMMIPDNLLRAFTAVSLTVPSSGQERIDAIIRKSMLWKAAKAAMQGLLAGGRAYSPPEYASEACVCAEALVAESERRAGDDSDKAEKEGTEGALCKHHNRWHCVECITEGGGDGGA